MDDGQKHGTRIFKKSTPNGKVTIYLGKRDFIDYLTHVDPVEGVVLVDPDYVKERSVYIHLLGAFWYGRDAVDLLGLNYHRDLLVMTKQVYPPASSPLGGCTPPPPISPYNRNISLFTETFHGNVPILRLTRLQERLIRKLGPNAYPFYFQLPAYSPASVSLLLNTSDHGKRCRVEYELKVYVAEKEDDQPQKRSSVRMMIRKLTYAPNEIGPQPSIELSRDFLMNLGSLRVEASLDKHKYYHGEIIFVNILIDNNSNKTVKRIKVSVRQYSKIFVQTSIHHKCSVAEIQSDEGFPISPSQTGWCKVYRLCPSLVSNRDKIGLAMDGDLKQEDTNLASSTITPPGKTTPEEMGIVVQYKVKIRLVLGFGLSDVCLQLPFILTHRRPDTCQSVQMNSSKQLINEDTNANAIVNIHSNFCENQFNGSTVDNSFRRAKPNVEIPQTTGINNNHPIELHNNSPVFNSSLFCSSSERQPVIYQPSHRPPSTIDTKSTISEDDLLFEDFARFRLRTNNTLHRPGLMSS